MGLLSSFDLKEWAALAKRAVEALERQATVMEADVDADKKELSEIKSIDNYYHKDDLETLIHNFADRLDYAMTATYLNDMKRVEGLRSVYHAMKGFKVEDINKL